jgi:hypothetical protein
MRIKKRGQACQGDFTIATFLVKFPWLAKRLSLFLRRKTSSSYQTHNLKEVLTVSESKSVKEKRKSPRVKTELPVRYTEIRDGVEIVGVGSLTCDVSTDGLRFKTKKSISTPCRLILELDIPSRTKPIKAVSKVAWIQKAKAGGDYEVGNQFMEITEKDRELIAKSLGHAWQPDESGVEGTRGNRQESRKSYKKSCRLIVRSYGSIIGVEVTHLDDASAYLTSVRSHWKAHCTSFVGAVDVFLQPAISAFSSNCSTVSHLTTTVVTSCERVKRRNGSIPAYHGIREASPRKQAFMPIMPIPF